MKDACQCCGRPTTHPETHHHNHTKNDNHPDNLQPVCRRCHMKHHNNHEAIDNLTEQRYSPPSINSPSLP